MSRQQQGDSRGIWRAAALQREIPKTRNNEKSDKTKQTITFFEILLFFRTSESTTIACWIR
jgi:hypothetical protein